MSLLAYRDPHTHVRILISRTQPSKEDNTTTKKRKKEKEEEDDKMEDEMSFDSGMLKRFRDCVPDTRPGKASNIFFFFFFFGDGRKRKRCGRIFQPLENRGDSAK